MDYCTLIAKKKKAHKTGEEMRLLPVYCLLCWTVVRAAKVLRSTTTDIKLESTKDVRQNDIKEAVTTSTKLAIHDYVSYSKLSQALACELRRISGSSFSAGKLELEIHLRSQATQASFTRHFS
ncbi:hypothetical protein OS493_031950 [Desmophyllum pertusum]|uniref:Uncharacterized protein n=1 Tax=Desmophyllum pertusum TaxID=174260 RepID=A0A9W9ZJP4_9CNID|nr:hypothetical protein OS493_031950 [Desmophyllum pertusum]